ncbi:class I SAM-dependent methyltransferase [Flagellimonas sp.]|uniref:class I SAM-dependent methyltransferase n=1 Tax=Flagellimonas sp. TaxID=2058762 RepID=UPI003B5106B7
MSFYKKSHPTLLKKIFDRSKEWTNSILFKGDKVYCCVCESKFRKFKTFGWKKKKKPRCYKCRSFARHRLIWKYLNDNFEIQKEGFKILHFAPEKKIFEILNANHLIEYYPCDLNPDAFHYPNRQKISKVDITNIPFESNYFDLILCNHVLEHVPEDKKAMAELFRVMKTNGFGIFQVPMDYSREMTYEDFSITNPKEREKEFGQFDHVRWYGRDYKTRLEKAGFVVDVNNFVNTFSKKDQIKYGFDSSELIYHCWKTI